MASELIGETESLCPECLARIPARRVAENGNIYLEKSCSQHGTFKVLIWRQKADHYLDWARYSEPPVGPQKSLSNISQGCPFDCGLCPEHQTNACTMVMEVTEQYLDACSIISCPRSIPLTPLGKPG